MRAGAFGSAVLGLILAAGCGAAQAQYVPAKPQPGAPSQAPAQPSPQSPAPQAPAPLTSREAIDQQLAAGKAALARRDYAAADRAFAAAMAEARGTGLTGQQALDLTEGRGDVAAARGDRTGAANSYRSALRIARESRQLQRVPTLEQKAAAFADVPEAAPSPRQAPPAAAAPSGPAIAEDAATGALVHGRTGARFAPSLNGLRRDRVFQNKPDGSDVTVRYLSQPAPSTVLTVTIDENPDRDPVTTVATTFQAMAMLGKGEGRPTTGDASAATPGGPWPGAYGILCNVAARDGARVCEAVHTFSRGGLLVKFRTTMPSRDVAQAHEAAMRIVGAFGWPAAPGGPGAAAPPAGMPSAAAPAPGAAARREPALTISPAALPQAGAAPAQCPTSRAAVPPTALAREIFDVDRSDALVHRATGARFPARLGNWVRAGVRSFEPGGGDVAVDYAFACGQPSGPMRLAIYLVIGPPQDMTAHAMFTAMSLLAGAQVAADRTLYVGVGQAAVIGGVRKEVGLGQVRRVDRGQGPSDETAVVADVGPTAVRFRLSSPPAASDRMLQELLVAMAQFGLPVRSRPDVTRRPDFTLSMGE